MREQPVEGQASITFWAPVSLKAAADAAARDREMSMAQYLRSLMAEASRRDRRQDAASA